MFREHGDRVSSGATDSLCRRNTGSTTACWQSLSAGTAGGDFFKAILLRPWVNLEGF